jgi:hypothetical protein
VLGLWVLITLGLPAAPVAGAAQSCEVPGSTIQEVTYGEDKSLPFALELWDRLRMAERALAGVESSPDLDAAHCAGRVVVALFSGTSGRHASVLSFSPGVLPADRDPLLDSGLAFNAANLLLATGYESEGVQMSRALLGDFESWYQPSARWDEIDAAVADWAPGGDSISALDGTALRVTAWGLIVAQASTLDGARGAASASAADVGASLQVVRDTLHAICTESEEPVCRDLGL